MKELSMIFSGTEKDQLCTLMMDGVDAVLLKFSNSAFQGCCSRIRCLARNSAGRN